MHFLFQLTYAVIVNEQNDGHFIVTTEKTDGKYTGVIKVATPLDRETKDLFNLNVSQFKDKFSYHL
jgi:hypothetical protein